MSFSYLQQQLRKFGIDEAKGNVGIAPYGWDWTRQLVANAKEQASLCEMIRLRKEGLAYQAIASELNRQSIPAKSGGKWWPLTVRKIVSRAIKTTVEPGT